MKEKKQAPLSAQNSGKTVGETERFGHERVFDFSPQRILLLGQCGPTTKLQLWPPWFQTPKTQFLIHP